MAYTSECVPTIAPLATVTAPLGSSATCGSWLDTMRRDTVSRLAPAPRFQSLSSTLATAVPPAGEATPPRSSYANTPGPVGRNRNAPRKPLLSPGSVTEPTPKAPAIDTGVVPQLTEPAIAPPASEDDVHPPAKALHA